MYYRTFLGDRVYVLQILKTFCALESSKMPLKTLYECRINWVDIGFYALFARSILTQSLMDFKIKLRKERPMDTECG